MTHKVEPADWLGIGAEAFGADDVTMIEAVKGVMFVGDFSQHESDG